MIRYVPVDAVCALRPPPNDPRAVEQLTRALEAGAQTVVDVGFEPASHFEAIYRTRLGILRADGIEVAGLAEAVEALAGLPPETTVGVLGTKHRDVNLTAFVDEVVRNLLALVEVPASLASPTPPPGVPQPH